ncbi:MAG: putative Ig protein, partial [Candidatus Angelobacter sp.]|nr:putative Ig protein [Candidatus Angelobacter sp.]
MFKFVKIVSVMSLLWCASFMCAQAAPPRIFFSDLESGANSGGQNNNGVWVTIWGEGFGATQGSASVTVGSGAVASYPLWSDGKIIFQLGAGAKSGSIIVNMPGIGSSNGLPFTVRAGNIFFVATTGNDANTGTFASPWKTIVKAKNTIAAGDTAYIGDGVAQTSEDTFTAYLSMDKQGASNSGTATAPKA